MSAKPFPGIIVGRDPKLGYLTYRSQQFVALAAPTRSGKGVGIVIPNLLTYPDSVVVLDLKLENFKYTSLFRQRHGTEACGLCAKRVSKPADSSNPRKAHISGLKLRSAHRLEICVPRKRFALAISI